MTSFAADILRDEARYDLDDRLARLIQRSCIEGKSIESPDWDEALKVWEDDTPSVSNTQLKV
jgi:hypothetical protein